eukprot:TRINITY_DN11189_c0_g1_i1.p1 TRINITY_DN11189_c0_g1~~TRINITY_DN11189_c0_g1_i1.p1  ORF type:complete len:473 (-),score=111.99 TRINITY_DN11189_c0_g1_i1:30-1448(-)
MDNTQLYIILAALVIGVILLVGIVLLVFWYKKSQRPQYSPIDDYLESVTSQRPRSVPVQEKQQSALMNARFYLRSSNYQLKGPLYEIGSRPNKYHFHVRKDRNDYLLGIVPRGKNCRLSLNSNTTRVNVRALVSVFQHPYVMPTLEADFLPGRDLLLTFRPYSKKEGSLKDRIHRVKPHKRYDEKYTRGTALKPKQIATFGRQILEGLLFFQLHDYPYPHLHCGNVIVLNGVCRLTDYENSLMGLKPHISLLSSLHSTSPEVLAFGCVLYEMATGQELEDPRLIKRLPTSCPDAVRQILEAIFYSKPQSATLEDVAAHPFFDVPCEQDPDLTDITPELAQCIRAAGPGDGTPVAKAKKKRSARKIGATSSAASSPAASSPAASSPAAAPSSAMRTASSTPKSSSVKFASSVPSPSSGGPAPPPPPVSSSLSSSGSSLPRPSGTPDRGSLLSSIRSGTKLKKAETNDRSTPLI